jgi:hypothetical protein
MSKLMPHPRKQILFVLLSLADLVLTWWLLGHADGQVYEANPVARWWLEWLGAAGLACFKGAAVLLVLVLVALIAHFRPCAAGRILGLGCAILGFVVLYSVALGKMALQSPQGRAAAVDRQCEQELHKLNAQTSTEIRVKERLRAFLAEVSQDLRAGQCTLRQAADRVVAWAQRWDPPWLQMLVVRFPNMPVGERVANCLICNVVAAESARPEAAWRIIRRLEREFLDAYGRTSRRCHRDLLGSVERYRAGHSTANLRRPRVLPPSWLSR